MVPQLAVTAHVIIIYTFTTFREHLLPDTGLKDPDLLKARLIGQEKNGGILFSWSVPTNVTTSLEGEGSTEEEEINEEGARVTCVGWHVFNTTSFITLYK